MIEVEVPLKPAQMAVFIWDVHICSTSGDLANEMSAKATQSIDKVKVLLEGSIAVQGIRQGVPGIEENRLQLGVDVLGIDAQIGDLDILVLVAGGVGRDGCG